MMAVKKIYTKPCVIGKEELKPDQAIASCKVKKVGYSNLWSRYSIKDTRGEAGDLHPLGWGGNFSSQEEKNEALVFPVYRVTIGKKSFLWEDLNDNGIFEYDGTNHETSNATVQTLKADNCQDVVVGWENLVGQSKANFIS